MNRFICLRFAQTEGIKAAKFPLHFACARRGGALLRPNPAAAEKAPPLRRGGKIANGDQGGRSSLKLPQTSLRSASPLLAEGAFGLADALIDPYEFYRRSKKDGHLSALLPI